MVNGGSVQDMETNCDGTYYTTQQLAIGEPTALSLLMCSLRKECAHTCSIKEHHAVPWSTTAVANCNVTYYVN